MQAQPASKAIQLFNELIRLLNDYAKGIPSNEIQQARVMSIAKRLAADVKRLDVALGFSAFGSVAAAENKYDEARKNHELSLQYAPDIAVMFYNYAASLFFLGHSQEAKPLAVKALRIDPGDLKASSTLASICRCLGDMSTAVKAISTWEKATTKVHPDREELDDSKEETLFCMTAAGPALGKIWDTPEEDEAWADL